MLKFALFNENTFILTDHLAIFTINLIDYIFWQNNLNKFLAITYNFYNSNIKWYLVFMWLWWHGREGVFCLFVCLVQNLHELFGHEVGAIGWAIVAFTVFHWNWVRKALKFAQLKESNLTYRSKGTKCRQPSNKRRRRRKRWSMSGWKWRQSEPEDNEQEHWGNAPRTFGWSNTCRCKRKHPGKS